MFEIFSYFVDVYNDAQLKNYLSSGSDKINNLYRYLIVSSYFSLRSHAYKICYSHYNRVFLATELDFRSPHVNVYMLENKGQRGSMYLLFRGDETAPDRILSSSGDLSPIIIHLQVNRLSICLFFIMYKQIRIFGVASIKNVFEIREYLLKTVYLLLKISHTCIPTFWSLI